jgi:hypothetical protein
VNSLEEMIHYFGYCKDHTKNIQEEACIFDYDGKAEKSNVEKYN